MLRVIAAPNQLLGHKAVDRGSNVEADTKKASRGWCGECSGEEIQVIYVKHIVERCSVVVN